MPWSEASEDSNRNTQSPRRVEPVWFGSTIPVRVSDQEEGKGDEKLPSRLQCTKPGWQPKTLFLFFWFSDIQGSAP